MEYSSSTKAYIIHLSILLVALFSDQHAKAQTDWKLQKSGNGIKVFTKSRTDSPIKSIKVEIEFEQSLDKVLNVIMDVNHFTEWIFQCKEATLIKRINEDQLIYHHVTDAPWPVADRDQYSKFVVTHHANYTTVHSEILQGFPTYKDCIRLQKSAANWTLTPVSKNQTRGEYTLSFDPAGNVPAWMINMFISEGPYKSFTRMKERLKALN
jgi:ribosome-associated toxin RatA of RatAB toxin-antitoxin module